jgi:hypothetical protein
MFAIWQRVCGAGGRGVGLRRVRAAVSGNDHPLPNRPRPLRDIPGADGPTP